MNKSVHAYNIRSLVFLNLLKSACAMPANTPAGCVPVVGLTGRSCGGLCVRALWGSSVPVIILLFGPCGFRLLRRGVVGPITVEKSTIQNTYSSMQSVMSVGEFPCQHPHPIRRPVFGVLPCNHGCLRYIQRTCFVTRLMGH